MGSLLDEFELDLLIFDESSVSNADGAKSTDSNDNVLLLGMPHEQTFNGDAPAITTSIVEEEEEATPFGNSDHGEGPCSNDNPDWEEGTVHCPNATFHGVFDGVTETPTASPDDIVSNEFDVTTEATEAPNDNTGNNEDIVDGVGMTSSPSKKPSASPSKKPESNDIIDIVDGVTVTTSSPSKKPSTASSKQPSGSTTITPANDTFDTSNVDETTYPSFYSCTATSEEDLVQGNGDGNSNGGNYEELPFRFNYEIYTSTSVDDITTVLSTFERQLANGVASSLGLVDCPDSSSGSGEIDDTAVEFAKRSGGAAHYPWEGGRQLMPFGGMRRTLQKERSGGNKKNRLLESTTIVGVSMDPTDELDTDLLNCTSSATLDTPSKCSPIIGAMTVWMTNAQQRHLRQLVDTDSKEEQEAMLFDTVQSYIEQNEESYLNDELLHVAYIGQRNLTTVGDTNIDGAQETIDMDAGDDGGLKNPLIALAAVGVFLALVIFGAAWVYRRRRQREAEPGLDMEAGAFPALTPESASNMYETQESPPTRDENVRSNNLFGLNGVPSDAASVQSRRELTPPSSLSIIGGASTLARELSYSSPRSSLEEESSDQQDTTQDSQPLLDMAPTMEYDSDESSTFEALDENDDESPVLPMSPMEDTVVAGNGPGAFDDTTPTASYDDDDDPQYSGLMV
eukprot:CAMPEP_0201884712 /NCGR_PEP_ID=MMETSP0902-20130614/17511_1 /ASSEMBLY_ACC=CAM_ASM_000551 /TAXON_ID=420261 /ORGANISM="Thalassiosira antarctica, Strain CCMP982" /LENGTH=680 /DNA_ID=CAMNT_0048413719 /DNA_START=114 /DNA_END=2156 /DNA_ORIENTATION=-